MTAFALLRDLAARDIILTATSNRLDVDGPADVLTDDLVATLRARKAELLDLLADENIETHNSALFDVVVEVDFFDGRRLRIPQEVWPEGWEAPF